jgi:two-component system chemotaxis sensor kinase CheA
MALDLSQFHQVFFEECAEALDGMESGLLGLEPGSGNAETINTIFRGAHSIKGGAATFAFTDVAGFTHVMETLLDRVRDGRKPITRPDIDLLLASVDCLRGMMSALQGGAAVDPARVAELKAQLEASLESGVASREAKTEKTVSPAPAPGPRSRGSDEITEEEFDHLLNELHGAHGAPGVRGAAASRPAPVGEEITEEEFDRLLDDLHGKNGAPGTGREPGAGSRGAPAWRITFRPEAKMFQSGNDPLRIFRELESLAPLKARADIMALPGFDALDPEECHVGWTLELGAGASREQIREAFAWVEDECELRIESLKPPAAEAAPAAMPAAAAPAGTPKPTPAASPAVPVPPATAASVPARGATPASGGESASIRVAIDKIDALINMVGELVITQSMLSQLSEHFDMNNLPKLMAGLAQLERNTRELQESVMGIRMLPISFAFNRFPRLVHDLSAKLGKKVELKMTGEQTELDKTVMEKIGDPLVHLVRNSLDHGLERPDVRRARGKPETGTLHLNAYHQSGNIVIEISDDGAGLPKDKILNKAKERGLVRDEATLTDSQICELIFLPGFSTAEQVSDLSGRGVGMDVVRRNIRALGGNVEIRSQEGEGTTITIRLPLTLAILDGQIVRVGSEIYIIPLVSIVESIKIRQDMVNIVANRGEVIRLREEYLQILRLYQVFDAQPSHTRLDEGLLVVVEGEGLKAGLFVDELLGQQQIVIKSLEANFRRIEGVSGATILGDGTVSLILDIPGLIKLAHRNAASIGVGGNSSNSSLAA